MIAYWTEQDLCGIVNLLWSGCVMVRIDEVGRGIACFDLVRCVVVWAGKVWALLFAERLRLGATGCGKVRCDPASCVKVWRDWLRVAVVWYVASRQGKVRALLFAVVVRWREIRRDGTRWDGARCGSAYLGAVRQGQGWYGEARQGFSFCGQAEVWSDGPRYCSARLGKVRAGQGAVSSIQDMVTV